MTSWKENSHPIGLCTARNLQPYSSLLWPSSACACLRKGSSPASPANSALGIATAGNTEGVCPWRAVVNASRLVSARNESQEMREVELTSCRLSRSSSCTPCSRKAGPFLEIVHQFEPFPIAEA